MSLSKGLAASGLAVVGFTALCVVLGLLTTVAGLSPDRDSFDPTEQSVPVRIHNDLSSEVIVQECLSLSSCRSAETLAGGVLRPGASVTVGSSDRGVANWHRISDTSGRVLGCLPLVFQTRKEHAVVQVSSLSHCPG